MIILPHTSIEKADSVAENLRHTVENHPFELDQQITISIGIGELKKSHTVHEMIGDIDSALYDAKKSGRNCVCRAS